MTYGYVMDVPQPIEFYDAVHAGVDRRSGGRADGMLLHLGRATATGFQVVEIWETKEQCDRYTKDVVEPAVAEAAGGELPPEPAREEFEPRALIIPSAQPAV